MNKPLLVVFLFLLLCSDLQAQKTSPVQASTDKSKILLGEQFDIVLGAHFMTGANLAFFAIDSLQHFEILQKSKIDNTDHKIPLARGQDGRIWPLLRKSM